MSSAGEEGAIETHRPVVLPGIPIRGGFNANAREALQGDSDVDRDTRIVEEGWRPKIDRRQSWNGEDRKHELQAWLLGAEKGKETGFTEISHDFE
ncbi:hypothetical protein BDV29DRAFT_169490 [Aspergillus leporis]|jgi:hypothetical protein|uniref:Uncharacterized protein n=1 Tax=Aspergillus leporis TaxID=41062 RepID=A0A5N5XBS5_9EURO|nr:hypothetical protein BDV29DRAFT_169490 [Aspergillus leporis]